jgi:signal transduction histidine kinase
MPKPEEKVLLADNEPRILAGLRRRLSLHFNLLTAESGAEAIKLLEEHGDIAAVVADLRMPDMDGIELLREMRLHWPEVRRITLTGNTDQATAVAAANQGKVFRFFTKPCDTDQLAAALQDAIEEYRLTTHDKVERQTLEIKAEAGERARKAFLSNMSHELLTPLNHVIGFSEVLEQRWRDKGEPDSLEYLDHIRESGHALLRLVHRILEISRLSSEDNQQKRSILEVAPIVREEISKLRTQATERNVTISFHAPMQPFYIVANEHDLRLALTELLDNAIKFNRVDGHVGVAISHSGDEITIRIADTGIGMGENKLAKTSEANGSCDDTHQFHGIGIGLTLAALFATSQGGKLTIDNRRGNGTLVMLSLKRATKREKPSDQSMHVRSA